MAFELALDGNPFLNLASFVTTYMEPEAERLMTDAMDKKYVSTRNTSNLVSSTMRSTQLLVTFTTDVSP